MATFTYFELYKHHGKVDFSHFLRIFIDFPCSSQFSSIFHGHGVDFSSISPPKPHPSSPGHVPPGVRRGGQAALGAAGRAAETPEGHEANLPEAMVKTGRKRGENVVKIEDFTVQT